MMVDEEELRRWIISLDCPLEIVAETDWKKSCCGRLPVFWRNLMKVIKPKQEIADIKNNVLLKETIHWKQRQHCSATKLGFIAPPPPIHYPRELKKLQEKLDRLQEKLQLKKTELRLLNEKRKRKCFELYEMKQSIITSEGQINLMKRSFRKLQNDIDNSKDVSSAIVKYKNYYEQDSTKEEETFQNFMISNKLNLINDIKEESILQDNSMSNNVTGISNGDDSFEIDTLTKRIQTKKLFDLILNYHKDLPDMLNRRLEEVQREKYEKMKRSKVSSECSPYKDGLLKMDVIHIRFVVETLRLKMDLDKVKNALSVIKPKILCKLANDEQIESFLKQCSNVCKIAGNEALLKELDDFKNMSGFYENLKNMTSSNMTGNFENSLVALENTKKEYLDVYSSCRNKVNDICRLLDDIKNYNYGIKDYIFEMKKNYKPDKILWNPDHKDLQKIYMKAIIKNPKVFETENGSFFECLEFLQKIIVQYDLIEKLENGINLLSKELSWLNIYNVNVNQLLSSLSSLENKNVHNLDVVHNILNYNGMEYLRPLQYFILILIRQLKFKTELDNCNKQIYDKIRVKSVLDSYLECKLFDLENTTLSSAERYIPKNVSYTDVDDILKDFYNLYNFFTTYSKTLDISLCQ